MVLHVDNFPAHDDIPTLTSADTTSIQEFLETNIKETKAENIRIIEWRPSLNFYKTKYVSLLSQVADFIKRMDAGTRTAAAFGKKWVRNFFRNIPLINRSILYRQSDLQVIITGSGPGLENALPTIKKAQSSSLIIASSSSVAALSANNIKPDFIIATDGGSWALKHIYPCLRNKKDDMYFALSLCAALPSQMSGCAFLLINDGSFWQNVILHELSLASVLIPQKGTVTATAVELALMLSGGNIYLAGLDFSVNDIRSHVKPYAFDSILFDGANRLLPVYSQYFMRSGAIKDGKSMDIYASWFRTQILSWPKRIFSITGTSVFKEGKPILNGNEKTLCQYFNLANAKEDPSLCQKRALNALLNALNNNEYSQNIKQEFSSLLFNGEENVCADKIKKAILEIAHE
ncbi:MAG: DUF115 domain-containing protein [Treponema sp.]|nr:DUF115 domain-containing protein [Treponema sp.]MCL2237046.1 DUF115 domain-containing protein [Treponema sp.]